ncbi:MAG: response regulator transcription factor [Candidatus Gracilibacteria bacterium]|nr:response regulator transcription factor [Candidatus Gracilibacteria bacterium]MDD2908479.1 response regulator transcription factor [Candidatus Gracilibacteria bacterium]
MKVLIVEDNRILSDNIRDYLEAKSIKSKQLFDGEFVNFELSSNTYDLVILDLGLPIIDGAEVCNRIRESGNNIPILVLTSRNSIDDKIKLFKLGTDDYLTKPFEYAELLMRIHALTKRTFSNKSNIIKSDNLEIDIEKRQIINAGKEIILSNLELNLLTYLLQNKGQNLSKENILEKVWGEYDAFNTSRTLDIHIGYLRKKLGKDLIKTIRGIGYTIN